MEKEVCTIEHSFKDFQDFRLIGKGGFGEVYKARCVEPKCITEYVAIKKIKNKERYKSYVEQEIKNLKDCDHKNIVKLYHTLENKETWLILELVSGGTLEDYLKNKKNGLEEKEAYEIFKQIVDALMYLHSKYIVHRDLTPRNILLTKDKQVKIIDLGLSKKLKNYDDKLESVVGTPNYMPPELRSGKKCSEKVDCWYLGLILHALLLGKLPAISYDIHNDGSFFIHSSGISDEANALLKGLLINDNKRLCIEAVAKSEFLMKYDRIYSYRKIKSYRSVDSGNGSNNYSKEQGNHLRKLSHDSGFSSKDSAKIRTRKKSHSVKELSQEQHFDLYSSKKKTFINGRTHSYECYASEDRKPYIALSSSNMSHQYQNNTSDAYRTTSRSHYKSQGRNDDTSCIDSAYKARRGFSTEPLECFTDPSSRYNNSLFERQLKVCSSSCSHIDYNEKKCSHIGTHGCQPNSYLKHHLSNSNSTENFSIHNLEPLNAARLKPKRHWIKQRDTVVHISTDRQVIVEVLKTKRDKKVYVSEVLNISTDGKEIKMYYPPKNTLLADDRPPPFPNDPTQIKTYIFTNFPYRKKYIIAKKFVDTLRAKTPKLINNGQNAKFYVMENSPDPDCRMDFYDGSTVTKRGKDIFITDKHGKKCFQSNSKSAEALWLEFENEKANCERILKFHESLEQPNFPIVIGLIKNDLYCSGILAGKENAPPSSMNSKHNMRTNYR